MSRSKRDGGEEVGAALRSGLESMRAVKEERGLMDG